jgi:hypothetical protein
MRGKKPLQGILTQNYFLFFSSRIDNGNRKSLTIPDNKEVTALTKSLEKEEEEGQGCMSTYVDY